jgi:hypothetical protein
MATNRSIPWVRRTGNHFMLVAIIVMSTMLFFSTSYVNDVSMFTDEIMKFSDDVEEDNVEPENIGSNANGVGSVEEKNNDEGKGAADAKIDSNGHKTNAKEGAKDQKVGQAHASLHDNEIKDVHAEKAYMMNRTQHFLSWFEQNNTGKLKPNADADGPILDFVIAGFAKCGTTTMQANLGLIAPMPVADVCTPPAQTVYYSYNNWVEKYQEKNGTTKIFRGTKCPQFVQGQWLQDYSKHVPRAKVIVGIRHPMRWFQSFWNMQMGNLLTKKSGDNPYNLTKPCPRKDGNGCRSGCPKRQLFCLHRGRFHNALASLGKTSLSAKERDLLGPDDPDGGANLLNQQVKNPVYLYEQAMLNEDYMWEDLRGYLGVDHPLAHEKRRSSHGKYEHLALDFCDDKFDDLRAMMMPIAYNVSVWLQEYFIPIAKDNKRTDVTIPRPDTFAKLVDKYKYDPCEKLIRLDNGTFALKYSKNVTR